MFADAIELVGNYTRPIKFIMRNYKESIVIPGTATLFFVNEDGYAITCKHVAQEIYNATQINNHYAHFKSERQLLPNSNRRRSSLIALEKKYDLKSKKIAEMKVQFSDCVDFFSDIDFNMSNDYDIALIHFKGFKSTCYSSHAVFAKDSSLIRPGDILCRLGYPFPEFSDYIYDEAIDEINWLTSNTSITPRFPIDGMFTRHIGDASGNIVGVELSTPGLRGQSGGPLFTSKGIVYGVQSMTNHLHLGFDMKNEKMFIDGKQETINNQPFLHVGQCVHVDIVKRFLSELNVKYHVGDSLDKAEVLNG